jgi:hypothetical protein
MLALVARVVLRPFSFDRIDAWRWNLTRLCRAAGVVFFGAVPAAWLLYPLAYVAIAAFTVAAVSFGAAGGMLLEVERREALVAGRSR